MKKVVQGQAGFLAASVLFVAFAALAGVLVQFVKGNVLDAALAGEARETLRAGLMLFLLIASEIALYFGYDYFAGRYAVGNTRALRQLYFARLLEKKPTELRQEQQGELVAQYTNQIDLISSDYLGNIPTLAEIAFKAVIVGASLFVLDYRVALLTLALLTTPLYVPKLVEKKLQKAQNANIACFQEHLAHVAEWISGFELIKNYSIEKVILQKFRKSNDEVALRAFAFKKMTYAARIISTVLSYMSHLIVLAFVGYLVLRKEFSAGQFFVAIGMIDQLSYPIIAVSVLLQRLVGTKPAAQKMGEMISEKHAPAKEKTVRLETVDAIRFEDVTFFYEEQSPVLKNLTFEVRAGEKCLIMGASGAGKSTGMNLLMDYFTPQSGNITIDGAPVASIANLNEMIAIMRQDAMLFGDTLRNNLTMYRDIPDSELIAMLERLNLTKFASAEGLDTPIKEGGANLSGGERKRISLARTLLRKAPVFIIDEPLANVDREAAAKIEDVLVGLKEGIVFVITHHFDDEKRKAFAKQLTL